jgi:flagellum-specific ATP synthase
MERRMSLAAMKGLVSALSPYVVEGRVQSVQGLLIRLSGPLSFMGIGTRIEIAGDGPAPVLCEIVGFDHADALAMPLRTPVGLRQGAVARIIGDAGDLRPSAAWLGRVLDAMGAPLDGLPPPADGPDAYPLHGDPPPAGQRQRLGPPIDLGIRAMNAFLPMRRGQRMGLFAGSGVGKSVLMAMIARNADADAFVICLAGERGRELKEFLEDDLGPEGLARSVVIVATSDEAALKRRQSAYAAMAVAEYLRDQGKHVLLMMDSVTRFAMAQREIGLTLGEPPTTKGYTPTVFAELPRLMERAGPGIGAGAISAIFTVLVDGGDHDEPIADAARGILDGHVVLERGIAERGRFPAIDILRSVSRTMPGACDPFYLADVREARRLLSTYGDMEELIRLGAYRSGTNPEVDRAILAYPLLEEFLSQGKEESTSLSESYRRLADIVNGLGPPLAVQAQSG